METGAPWWGDSAMTLAGTTIGVLVTVGLAMLSRRTERRRLTREQKLRAYPEMVEAVDRLRRLPVWPVDAGDPEELVEDIRQLVNRVAFFAETAVSETLSRVLTAAGAHARLVGEVRSSSAPGRRNAIDQRLRPDVGASRRALGEQIDRFVVQARRSLEIGGRYRSLRDDSEPEGSSADGVADRR